MILYVDSSAFAKRHLELEEHHNECIAIMDDAARSEIDHTTHKYARASR